MVAALYLPLPSRRMRRLSITMMAWEAHWQALELASQRLSQAALLPRKSWVALVAWAASVAA